jgi:hypothetical protein
MNSKKARIFSQYVKTKNYLKYTIIDKFFWIIIREKVIYPYYESYIKKNEEYMEK